MQVRKIRTLLSINSSQETPSNKTGMAFSPVAFADMVQFLIGKLQKHYITNIQKLARGKK